MNNDCTLQFDENPGDAVIDEAVARAIACIERIYADGAYPRLAVQRRWSSHNPAISGEMARPEAFRWYLQREIGKLLRMGARIQIMPSRERTGLDDAALLDSVDEEEWDFRQKKLFLFRPERIELSLNRIEHYTGTNPADFQRYIIFTNYEMHVDIFTGRFSDHRGPSRAGVQMPAYHHRMENNLGITLVNIGVGPSNAKTITDHVAVLRPDAMIMVGHCAGLRNHQAIGDYVVASGYMRDDRVLDDLLPLTVPVSPNYALNAYLVEELAAQGLPYRIGTVFTTDNRNWEFSKKRYERLFSASRSIAIDMESATIAANGFRYRIPHASLLAVSDKPLHGTPKLSGQAQEFYAVSKERHLDVAVRVIERCRSFFPDGFPNDAIRGADEPLLGSL